MVGVVQDRSVIGLLVSGTDRLGGGNGHRRLADLVGSNLRRRLNQAPVPFKK